MSRKMREKYAKGLVSKYYLETGIPQNQKDRLNQLDEDIKELQKKNEKTQKKAKKEAYKEYRKRHGNCKEYRIIFY